MSIGTTIKRLRRERSITQEQLAEYLGISTGAVSQWECDRTAPDITQLPLLANIFDVSADELLEIGGKKKEEVIQAFLRKYDELSYKGDLISKFDLTKQTYAKYPNDYRVIEKYILELFGDPNCLNEPLGEEVHKDELFKLCENLLEHCTTQKIRYTAMDVLAVLYVNDGNISKAKEIYEQFPDSIYDTVSELYEQMYCRCDGEKHIEFIKKNLRYTTEHLINKIRNFGTFAAATAEDKIRAYKKCISLIELIYDDGDYGFACYHVGHIHCLIAKLYYGLKDTENAVLHLEKGLHFSKAYDELPTEVTHTSLLLKNDIEDLSEVNNSTQMNRVAYEIEEFKKVSGATSLESEYCNILNKYAQFAKAE
jgi:transcriptional regulator with XRE-family HTH domain